MFLNALLRDAGAVAAEGRALTLKILRPDGFEVDRRQAADAGAGSYSLGLGCRAPPRPASGPSPPTWNRTARRWAASISRWRTSCRRAWT